MQQLTWTSSTHMTRRSHVGLCHKGAHTAVVRAHSLPVRTSERDPHANTSGCQSPTRTAPRIRASSKRGLQRHTQIRHTHNRSACVHTHHPHPKRNSPSRDHCPSTFCLGKTRPGLAPLALSSPWPGTDPARPAPACSGGAPPAPSASCQLSTGQGALGSWLPPRHVAGPTPSSWACRLSTWAPAWVLPRPFLQSAGRASDPQSWGLREGQDPSGKAQPIPSPLVPSPSSD